MPYISYIQELLNLDSTLNINHIHWWLIKYEDDYRKAIGLTECRKWKRFLMTGEEPFPCACPTRVEDCIFIELYFKLDRVLKLMLDDEMYEEVLIPYEGIKHNKKAVFEWVKANEQLGKHLYFDGTIQVTTQKEPYKKIDIRIDKSECENLHKFIEVFKTNYYSLEYNEYYN
ncbi:hypothetical protein MKD41_09740 [Lutibacter sp. A64]|uniref:hypothetical protein n=1 Tax=Lutibacter sp. A64 TaxID=2918526 RepID=UPI001F063425|nr:hypothetical protein [Lutibacter sp. A64]UMB52618.1 hypothetical protein MKD41_09740 [Lutibacter sp. A64]